MFVPKLSEIVNYHISKPFFSEGNFQKLLVLSCWVIFIGFVCSRALVSISMTVLVLSCLLHNGIADTLRNYARKKDYWVLSLFFIIVLGSGLYSENRSEWLTWVRIKLPYLVLPLAFAPIKKIGERNLLLILYGYIAIFFFSTSAILINYFMNYESITDSFLRGNAIPMPYSHIRYTLMLAFALFCAYYILEKDKFLVSQKERWLQILFIVFSFIALHILSVRSALLALYLGIALLIVRSVIVNQNFLKGSLLLLTIIGVLFLAVRFVPSLHNKWAYMQYDMQQFRYGQFSNLSDGTRLLSVKAAYEIGRENMFIGVGAGDLKTAMQSFYQEHLPELPETDRKMPHNQFVWVWASTGIIGLTLFLIAFFFPLFYKKHFRFWPFLVLHLVLFSSFFTEATLEEQMGTGFYLIFLLLFLNQIRDD